MPTNTIRRVPRQKVTSRSKKITNIYNEDFGDVADDTPESFNKPKKSMRSTIFAVFIIGLLAGGGLGLLMNQSQLEFLQNKLMESKLVDKSLPAYQRAEKLLRSEFGTEKPVSAVVTDVSVLADLPLYEFAKNGDSVFLYKDMAVIYDEVANKIVSAVPQGMIKEQVDLGVPDSSDSIETSSDDVIDSEDSSSVVDTLDEPTSEIDTVVIPAIPAKDITVELRNGTRILGHAGKNANLLKELGYTTKATNAIKTSYKESVIVNLAGEKVDLAHLDAISEALSITSIVDKMPEGEVATKSDIVVILGAQ